MDKYPNDQSESTIDHKPKRTVWIVVAVVIVIVIAFGLFGYLHRPITGTVTAVSASSITIRPNGGSTTKTYSIINTTLVGLPKSSGEYGTPLHFNVKYVKVGDTVDVSAGSDNEAQAVTVNP